jgi:hypothetical protein
LSKLTASFKRGVFVGDSAHLIVVQEGEDFVLQIVSEDAVALQVKGRLGPPVFYSERLPSPELRKCRVRDYANASQAQGTLPLMYSAADAERLFPHLTAALPPFQLAALLATTRLVGMECPGLNSLYSSMALIFDKAASGPA